MNNTFPTMDVLLIILSLAILQTVSGQINTDDCLETQYKCGTGTCIPKDWECDNDTDCADSSDEKSCSVQEVKCSDGSFQCGTGVCINNEFVCDGDEDCLDKTDEQCEKTKFRRICYFTNWAQYRKDDGKFTPEHINPDLCTHLVYAFAKLEGTTLDYTEHNDPVMYKLFNNLKNKTRGLKTMLSIGGWNAGSKAFSEMVATSERRAKFTLSAVEFLRRHKFDGLDIDWEYPTLRQGKMEDKPRLALLIKELRSAFELEAKKSHQRRLLISVAVPTGKKVVDSGYDIPTLVKNADFLNLMSYDFHGGWEGKTGHNSPLFQSSTDTDDTNMNIEKAAKYWVSKGTPKMKLNIGMATYGRSFVLADPDNSFGIGAMVTGPGPQGPFTKELGFYSYYEVCKLKDDGEGHIYRDEEQMVPYYVKGDLWVGYDDVESLKNKAEWLAREEYGGSMVWSLSLDDFSKMCSSSIYPFPLTRAISSTLKEKETRRVLNKKQESPIQSQASSNQLTTLSTTSIRQSQTRRQPSTKNTTHLSTVTNNVAPPPIVTPFVDSNLSLCRRKPFGYYPDPNNCHKYFVCHMGRTFSYTCPSDLRFNPKKITCDWPNLVPCDDDGQPMR